MADDITARFQAAWMSSNDPATATIEMLPTRLAKACVEVLPVDGAGLSLISDGFRVPLGASDTLAGHAERLQFTHGEGPCLEAANGRHSIILTAEDIKRRWPRFAEELFRQTPYRGLLSIPLALRTGSLGAIDLYLRSPEAMPGVDVADAFTIAEQIVDALLSDTPDARRVGGGVPAWLAAGPATHRTNVWVAMGILMQRLGLAAADALALLRARAYSGDTLLDDVAAELIAGDLDLDEPA
jgi:hypothetical protein